MRTEPTSSAAGRLRLLLAVVALSLAALLGGTAWWWSTAQSRDGAALAAQHPELARALEAAQNAAARERRQVLSWVGSALVVLLGVAGVGILRLARASAERRTNTPATAPRPVPVQPAPRPLSRSVQTGGQPRSPAGQPATTDRTAPADGPSPVAEASDRKSEFGELLQAFRQMSGTLSGLAGQLRAGEPSVPTPAPASTDAAPGPRPDRRRPPKTFTRPASAPAPAPTPSLPPEAEAVVTGATAAARRGGEVVQKVVHNMEDIAQASREIAQLIGVVDSIAFQTNLLALNAAVESARATDQGRGYAVVASEVRRLAQRSALAAREIQALVGASKETVESSAALVAVAGTSMGAILGTIQQVNRLMSKVTGGSAAESAGARGIGPVSAEVVAAVGQLDQITEQNAPLVEQSAAAAADIRAQAAQLAEAVHLFRSIDTHALGAAVQAEAAIRAAAEKGASPSGDAATGDDLPGTGG